MDEGDKEMQNFFKDCIWVYKTISLKQADTVIG